METMEKPNLQTQTFRIGGMTCINCQNRIERKLKTTAGVEDTSVSYETGEAKTTYDASVIDFDGIAAAVESLGYIVLKGKERNHALEIAGALVIILALSVLLHAFGTSRFATAFPTAQEGMGYGMLLVIGLLTSVHCIGMCGGINLSQTLRGAGDQSPENGEHSAPIPRSLVPSVLYNGGRLASYTAVGVAVGALGSVITVSGRFQGAVQLAAGVFMLIMGINMLGLFPFLRRFTPGLPRIFAKKVDEQKIGRGPLVVGFLNGFIPCGPLQAMQLYALSTGSPVRGGVSMFLFCLGTIPLMFALGAASGILSGAKGQVFSRRVMRAGAVLVAAMGVTMFVSGWSLTGFETPVDWMTEVMAPASGRTEEGGAFVPEIRDGMQIVNSILVGNRYPAIVVQQGVPVRWTISAPPGSINGCNNRMIIREYGIEYAFRQGDNVIEFIPEKTGRFSYSCWMGMIRSSITVVGEGESIADVPEPDTAPTPAGVEIPTDEITLAEVRGNFQAVTIRLGDDGFEPAVVVMQRYLPTIWTIDIYSPDPGNSLLIFPAYYSQIDTRQGDNNFQIFPEEDFEFSTGDNVFYGYVKVVDDINLVDIEAIKVEIAGYETLIYPEAHFEVAMGSGCPCCQ